jgi:hypothetical protein
MNHDLMPNGRAWLALLAVSFVCAGLGVAAQRSAGPRLPFEDAGACPFEGCVYREWRARSDVEVRVRRRADAPVAFRVRAGERVTAVTGVVVTTRAGRVQFDAPQRLVATGGTIEIEPGQTLYLLTYQGEGFTKAWFNGRLYQDVDASSFLNDACTTRPARCAGRVIEPAQTEWWVQIRNQAGEVGWTREPSKFDGKDALE